MKKFVIDLSFGRVGWFVKMEPITTIANAYTIYYKPITNPFKTERIDVVYEGDFFEISKAELGNKSSFESYIIVLKSEGASPLLDRINSMFSVVLKERKELKEKAQIAEAIKKEVEFWSHTRTLSEIDKLAELQEKLRKKGLLKERIVKKW